MKDRTLRRLPPVQYEAVYAGLPARHSTCAVFDARKHEKWCDEMDLHGPWIVLVDQVLAQTPSFKRIRNQQLRGEVVFELSLAGGETLKSLDSAAAMLSNLAENGEASRSLRGGAVLIVGGGTLLNFGGFIANVLYRGLTTVLVPTTVMAIADVAIGSKTSLNLLTLEGMDRELAAKLADAKVFTRDDLGELAVDELMEATGVDEARAKDLILKARAHWFAGESAT